MATRREYSHTVFNQVPDTAREEAYADAKRMTAELRRKQLAGSVEVEVVYRNPRTYDIFVNIEED